MDSEFSLNIIPDFNVKGVSLIFGLTLYPTREFRMALVSQKLLARKK
jgi:hypothetical protein